MAVLTNAGLNLWATAIQTGGNPQVTYISVGTGAGTLSSALTNGTNYTSITIIASVVKILASQSLTLIDTLNVNTQVVTCNSTTSMTVGQPATIPVTSFNANANYNIGSGLVNTPAASDLSLQNEVFRITAAAGFAGVNPGESLNPGYMDVSAPTNTYVEVGYWGGVATASLMTGTLIARDVQYWNHTLNADSASFQLDTTL